MAAIKRLIRRLARREISDELMEAYLAATEPKFDRTEVEVLRERGLL